MIYIETAYGSTNNGCDILKFYVGDIVSNHPDNTYCNSTMDKRSFNWETVACENGGFDSRRLF